LLPCEVADGDGQQEANDLEREALWRNSMNVLGQQRLELAEGGFDALADGFAQELEAQRQRTLEVLLALGAQGDASGFLKEVFLGVVGGGRSP